MKICTVCREKKDLSEFHIDSRVKSGRRADCKECNRKKSLAFALDNRERARLRAATWYRENTEKAKASADARRLANPEKENARRAAWVAKNPEKRRATSRASSHNRRALKRVSGDQLSVGLADKLFKLQRGKCACGCAQPLGDDYHIDHRMPLALGGEHADHNIQLLRKTCNLHKSAKHPVEFMQQRGFLL